MRIRDLSKGRKKRLQSGESSTVAEEIVAGKYGLNHRPNEAEWYDCINENTGTKTEVKSCFSKLKGGAKGRFRLRRDQTRSLLASDGQNVAWYGFVLFDVDSGEIEIRRAKPSTVSSWVTERGGWNTANHSEFDEQHKLPFSVVF